LHFCLLEYVRTTLQNKPRKTFFIKSHQSTFTDNCQHYIIIIVNVKSSQCPGATTPWMAATSMGNELAKLSGMEQAQFDLLARMNPRNMRTLS
jgi:hypothetical protein